MADLKDLINPFVRSGLNRLFEALRTGPKTAETLVDKLRVCKTYRQVSNLATVLNRLDGVKVRYRGDKAQPTCEWQMVLVNESTKLLITNIAEGTVSAASLDPSKIEAPASKGTTSKASKRRVGNYVVPPIYSWIKDSVQEGENIFLVGPSGSGKTVLARFASRDLEATFIRQNFNGETTIDNMIGYTEIAESKGASITKWHDGELAKAVRLAASGKKVVYLADEVTAGKPEILFQFHRVMEILPDGSREMEVNGELLTVPAGKLTIMGTGNSFRADESGLYQGSNVMNKAFCNRWTGGVFLVDFAENEDEVLEGNGVEKGSAKFLVDLARLIREKALEENIPIDCSTRQLVSIGKKIPKWGVRKALEHLYLSTLTSDERRVVDDVLRSIPALKVKGA